jgi:hypothetical protein
MKTCPYCQASIGESDRKCWYCDTNLKGGQDTDDSMLQAFLALPKEISDIVGGYGTLLNEMGREKKVKLLRPLSKLPHPKKKIERALKTALGIVKDENLKNQLELVSVCLEDFIPDVEVPEDPDENFKSWVSRKNWKDPKASKLLARVLNQPFIIKEYGGNAEKKVQKILRDLEKKSNS